MQENTDQKTPNTDTFHAVSSIIIVSNNSNKGKSILRLRLLPLPRQIPLSYILQIDQKFFNLSLLSFLKNLSPLSYAYIQDISNNKNLVFLFSKFDLAKLSRNIGWKRT